MSDVRDELMAVMAPLRAKGQIPSNSQLADAILERFEVTPRPAISDEELGRMVERAWAVGGDPPAWKGQRMLAFLGMAGLEIVRKEAGR